MPNLTNLSFETVAGDGVSPASWTITYQSSVESYDVFADGGVLETFETGWDSNQNYERALTSGNSTEATWTNPTGPTPVPVEGFEVGWHFNQSYDFGFSGSGYAFSSVPSGQEGFEANWHTNQNYETHLPISGSLTGNSPPIANGARPSFSVETFETNWYGNSSYDHAWVDHGGTANGTQMPLDGARGSNIETFEFVLPDSPLSFTVSSTSIDFYGTPPFSIGYSVSFYSTGTLPVPFATGTKYAVYAISTPNFSVELSVGGPITCTGAPSGAVFGTFPYEFWTTVITL